MAERTVETAIALWGDRHLPPAAIAEQARAVAASDGIDGILLADQITNFIPRQLWTAANTPMAQAMGDPDSHGDVFALAGYLLASAPGISLSVSTDSVRRPPAELVQTMLTLANMAEGRASFHVGGGEAKQCKPFGHKRSQGLSRMEDLFRVFHALLDAQGEPVDVEGRHWTLRNATIGGAMPHRPAIYGLGAGPTLLEHTAKYCDGLAITCPPAWAGPEAFAAGREQVLEMVAANGRDPEAFRFAVWFPVLLGDHDLLDRHLDNAIVRWLSAMFGRIDATQWAQIGLESPVPLDWAYFMHFLPYDTPQALIDDALAKTTREHVRACWLTGTPEEVAAMVQPYIDAGADWVCPMDYLPLVLEPDEAAAAFGRSVELCDLIKAAQLTGTAS
jgi:phthiodiolone/phenolphthiodiolone dimycocerosates ketoreductase